MPACPTAGRVRRYRPLDLPEDAEAPSLADLKEVNHWLKDVWIAVPIATRTKRRSRRCAAISAHWKHAGQTGRVNVDLAHLLRPDSLLAVNIGSLPAAELKR